jgi:toxin-antitoxin system PIN domain toxin
VADLLDVNVLIALHDPTHTAHPAVIAWFSTSRAAPWASCPITENGFIRIVSQPTYGSPVRPKMAANRLRATMSGTSHEFWPDDISILSETMFHLKHVIGHRQVTDAYLLALAVKRGGRFVTLDRAMPIDAVVGATAAHVVTLGG